MSSSFPNSEPDCSPHIPVPRRDGSRPRGRLQLFLGYAAGVGKTCRMLDEAQLLRKQGKDIVVGYFEPHGRKDTIAKTADLEMISTKAMNYRNVTLREMDIGAIVTRRPAICAVDELAHTNVPGSERCKRWEDVQMLLDEGIDVMTTMNIQHLESLNDQIFHITGIRVRETVPDWLVKSADEVVMVDATTEALMNRLKRGDIYAPDKAQRAMENFFTESTLASLRELALRQTAHELDFRETSVIPEPSGTASSTSSSAGGKQIHDRILICVTADSSTAMLIRRGRRMAEYLGADCFAIAVLPTGGRQRLPIEAREAIERHLNFAKNLHVETLILENNEPAQTIVDFARRNQITQILLSRSKYNPWSQLLGTDLVLRVVRKAKDIRVSIVAERRRAH